MLNKEVCLIASVLLYLVFHLDILLTFFLVILPALQTSIHISIYYCHRQVFFLPQSNPEFYVLAPYVSFMKVATNYNH